MTEESSKIRGTEYMHVPIYVIDSLKIDENEDNEVGGFIDKCIHVLYRMRQNMWK